MTDDAQTVVDEGMQIVSADTFELLPWVVMLNRHLDLAGEIGERIAQGERLWDIARGLGVKRRQLKRWIDADPERLAEYTAGLEAMADELAMDTLEEARGANPETVGVAKLRVDTFFKMAGKLDSTRWGDKGGAGAGGITVVVQRAGTEPPMAVSGDGRKITI